VKYKLACGNIGSINLNTAYKASFKTIAANKILPPSGASTWAFNSQEFKPYNGVFTAIAIKIPANKTICKEKSKSVLNTTSKYVDPATELIVRIESNIKRELPNVYKNK
jgi:hypothetical protein